MADNAVLIKPSTRASVTSSVSAAVRSLTYLNGFLYGITFGAGTTQMAKVPLFGTTTNQTLSIAMTNVQDMANDGTFLYAAEERGSAAGASNNQLMQISTTGTATALTSTTFNMRSVVYDEIYNCLYISCPFDSVIRRASGGGIGGSTDTFVISDFITGITNQPGRLWLDSGSTKLYFTTESNDKTIAAVSLSAGTPGEPSYYSLMGGTGETTNLLYFEALDVFLYAGPNATTGLIFAIGAFAGVGTLTASTRFSQGVVFTNDSFAYSDGTTIRYVDITSFS